MLILFSHFLHIDMRSNTIISQLTNENHMIKVKYNELFQHCKELEEKVKELESQLSHIESIPPLCPCAPPPPHPSPMPSPPSTHQHHPHEPHNREPVNYNTIIQTLESKILELNKQIIQQNKHTIGN